MKVRSDFVSNSSSCSFFIQLDTQEAIDALKQIRKKLESKNVDVVLYDDFNAVCACDGVDGWNFVDHYASIGSWVNLCSGDDNMYFDEDPFEFRTRFDAMANIVNKNPAHVKFKIYEDPQAHITIGEEFPNE